MGLIYDWLLREGSTVLAWWALVTLAGVAVFPLCMRLLSGLPDKGYTLARAVGLLVVGFVFWAFTVMGFFQNTPGSILLAWLLVLVGAWALYYALPGERANWREWWRENRGVVLMAEALFILLLFGWALVRAAHPSLAATEKPMELAFISAVQRSESFPPLDPWMSGYAISYYHFGYVMAGSLSTLSGIDSPVGFNMMIALLFALTGLTAFGVTYNLVRSVPAKLAANGTRAGQPAAISVGVLGAVFVVLLGNFQLPFIELPYQSGIGNDAYYQFWDAQERTEALNRTFTEEETVNVLGADVLDPARWSFWWWFRASRVINDRHLPRIVNGELVAEPVGANVIDEFPQFSFLLADVHPHVLALPFAVMAVGLALNILLVQRAPTTSQVVFYGLAAGGLIFLNVWDGPIYIVVLVGAEGLRRLMRRGSLNGEDILQLGLFFGALVGLSVVFYLPFFASFRSQASGILPNLEFPTLFRQYFLMFGPFVLLLVPYMVYEAWRGRQHMNWRAGLTAAGIILLSLLGVMLFLTIVGYMVPDFRRTALRYVAERGGLGVVLPDVLAKRFTHGITTVVLLAALTVVVARLLPRRVSTTNANVPYSPAVGFALLLVACGAGITLVPEFIYLRDNFGVRINTIFKFYYQAWVMFSIASAFAVYMILAGRSPAVLKAAYAPLLALVLILGAFYPVLGIHNRVAIESGRAGNPGVALTLDGGRSLVSADDYDAMMCLDSEVQNAAEVVVAEAIGPAYRNQFGRVGVLTGIPIVLGWEGHQRQWRGATYDAIAGTRRQDIETLYNELRWEAVTPIVERYNIDYIFYGTTERYGTGEVDPFSAAGEEKFRDNLEIVCQRGESLFYRVTPRSLTIAGVE